MDWQALISDLIGRGLTQVSIAASVPCAQSTISDISRGAIKDPGYKIAAALLDLKRKTARRRAKATA